jgi:NAD+ kinase
MGFNIGSLGFMTSVAEDDIDQAMDALATDNFITSRRTVQEIVVVKDGRETGRYRALNDTVVSSGASNRVVTLAVSIDGNPVTSYVCDGLIVSTPTGSTGHNLSAGGPIVTPEARSFVISLICPHTLSSRPLVVQDESEILIQGQDLKESGLLLSVDGQVSQTLNGSEHIIVRAGKPDVQFIHLPGQHFFKVLSQKLGWKGSSRATQ